MKKFTYIILRVNLIVIVLLIALSVLAAFCGQMKVKQVLGAICPQIYWTALIAIVIATAAAAGRLLNKPALLMIHTGLGLVLIGCIWGSQAGHTLAERLLGISKIPRGYLLLSEKEVENSVFSEDFGLISGELAFGIRLNDFRLEYYKEKQPQTYGVIKDYVSDVSIIENAKEVEHKTIEVNHPLHYRGYHFYQHSYDPDQLNYSILFVRSDSGLYIVYAGFLLVSIGSIVRFWFVNLPKRLKLNG